MAAGGRVVIGIGNPDRGADGAGPCVARLVRGRLPDDVRVLESSGEATELLGYFETVAAAYLVDAAVSGAPAGTIRRFDCAAAPLPQACLQVSTHGFGPAEAIELARALGELPRCCVVYAIEVDTVEPGEPLSATMRRAAEHVAEKIVEELEMGAAPAATAVREGV